jgi:transglutaminase-like putative cysteine protease
MAVELEVQHDTRYDYVAPVSQAHHLAHLKPLQDDHQVLLAFELDVDPAPVNVAERIDTFGNTCHPFSLALPHGSLRVRSRSRLRLLPRFDTLEAAASPAWESLRDGLRYVALAPYDPAVEFIQPTRYVPRLEALRSWGRPSFPPGRPLAEAAIDLMHRLHAEFTYRSQSTQVDTPVAEAFERRTGVCQDFAHVMLGALRMLGLPARYVSGYLLTHASTDGHELVGADASHAWVQVYAPGTPGLPAGAWLDLDPTNDVIPGTDHIRVAVGRDYGDVAPLRGVIRGGGRHTLTVGVTTRRLGESGAAGPVVA